MDEAFVQDAEQHVGREHGGEDENALALEQFLEHRGRALEAGTDSCGNPHIALDGVDGVDRLPERVTGGEIERNGHRWLVGLVIDQKRARPRG